MTPNPWAEWLRDHEPRPYSMSRKEGWVAFANATPRPAFETLNRAQMSALDEETLEDYNEARMVWNSNLPTVRTHQAARAYDIIDEVMASNRRDSSSLRGTVVLDATGGLGKTTTSTQYGREFHRAQVRRHGPRTADGSQRLPVAFIPLSAGMTLKNLNQKLLEFYGHPAASRVTRAQLGSLAVDCVLGCETKMIILDDLHFIDFRHRNGTEVSNHLKWLANELPATFIYVGVALAKRRFFDEGLNGDTVAYSQTSRRATRCPIVPFSISSDAGARAWTDLLATFEHHLLLADARPGMLASHAKLLFKRTQGHIGSLTQLLNRACYVAIKQGTETLDAATLTNVTVDNAAHNSEAAS